MLVINLLIIIVKMNDEVQLLPFTINVPSNLLTKNVRNFEKEVERMVQLYAKKNHDYGNSFNKGMDVIGIKYGVGRLFDKMNRIITLTDVKAEINDESITDTIRDLACYSVMMSAYISSKGEQNKLLL